MKRLPIAAIYILCFSAAVKAQEMIGPKAGEKELQFVNIEHHSLPATQFFKNYNVFSVNADNLPTFTEDITRTTYPEPGNNSFSTSGVKIHYSRESGALNEGFIHIFGRAVKLLSSPANGEQAENSNGTPTITGNSKIYNQPHTYKGIYWYAGNKDNSGAHTNSSVLNFWFQLLANGGAGINDKSISYSVTGIRSSKSRAIAYRTLVTYLTPVSEYRDARRYAVKSAEDLYGIGSEEALQTAKAWDAVGVDETTNEKENNLTKHNNIVQ